MYRRIYSRIKAGGRGARGWVARWLWCWSMEFAQALLKVGKESN